MLAGTLETKVQLGLTVLGYVYPDGIVIECVLVCIEALEGVLVPRVISVHGSIVLVAKDDARAGYAFSRSLCALSTDGLLLITLQLPLTASEAVTKKSQEATRGL